MSVRNISQSVLLVLSSLFVVACGHYAPVDSYSDVGQQQSREPQSSAPYIQFNQKFVEGLYTPFDEADKDEVFRTVFQQLPAEVHVYPSENYYYFSIYAAGKWYWGNFRLGVEERDDGYINFVYWEFIDDPKSVDESPSWHKRLGMEQGVAVRRLSSDRYAVTFQEKTVTFQLHPLDQKPPHSFNLMEDEVFVSRSWDESGYRFFLLYKATHAHFMWLLNEEEGFPGNFVPLTEDIVFDKLSGFVFFIDKENDQRKILIGAWAQNVRRNNYWDGPFDQLADNNPHPRFAEFIQQAYPYTTGRVDHLGIFTDEEGTRLAISSYYDYESLDEIIELVTTCKNQPHDELLPCLTYDYKTSIGR